MSRPFRVFGSSGLWGAAILCGALSFGIPSKANGQIQHQSRQTPIQPESLGASGFSLCAAPITRANPAPPNLEITEKTVDTWHGFRRHRFLFEGRQAWIVEPSTANAQNLFSWCLMFPDAFTERCAAIQLLEHGFFHVFLDVGNSFGSPSAIKQLSDFHEMLIQRGFAKRAVLIGISRGGLYAHRYAVEHPSRVSVIYGDAPVLDFKSWPGGFGTGKGSPSDWKLLKELYGFQNETDALAYSGNPIDTLEPLAKHGINLIYVAGDVDNVVPWSENGGIAVERYQKLGGKVEFILKKEVGHHPHGLENPEPVVNFILEHAKDE